MASDSFDHRPAKKGSRHNAGRLWFALDEESKACLGRRRELRRISVSDYVRTVTLPRHGVRFWHAREEIIALLAEEQLAFWKALNETSETHRRAASSGFGHARRVVNGVAFPAGQQFSNS